ncbi:MAG TPA: SIS domain-containing protein [Candidatus Limnocylindria bacterium]|nr:SIS domain-containing protein [Candidatus Limnocylindria bacterium]
MAGATQMRREIEEIPAVIERLVAESSSELAAAAEVIGRANPGWIMIAGRGTSDHAGVYAQYLFETHLGLPTGLVKPSVTTIYGTDLDWSGGLVVAISQSGRSPDVVEVVEAARRSGALTLAITNEADSPLAAAAELNLACRAGHELAVPATKTYVAELAALAALVGALRPSSGIGSALASIPDAVRGTLALTDAWLVGPAATVVTALAAGDRALLVSRGYNLATAFELALKLKETCGLFAEAYSTADFAHGPLVLSGAGVPTLAIRPGGEMGELVDATVTAVADRGGHTTVIGGPEVAGRDGALALPYAVPESLSPLLLIVPGQLLVEATARRRGIDPDSPAGLLKVTLTH